MTRAFTIGVTVVIVLVDVAFVATGRETISEFIYGLARSYPIVPAAFGVLMGHLFWPVRGGRP